MITTEICAAIVGTTGIIALSLFTSEIIEYFVGIGMFGVVFLLAFASTGDLNISTLIAMTIAIITGASYKWVIDYDVFSAMLLISIATIGIMILTMMFSSLCHIYSFDIGLYSQYNLCNFHRNIIGDINTLMNYTHN